MLTESTMLSERSSPLKANREDVAPERPYSPPVDRVLIDPIDLWTNVTGRPRLSL
jgi:hypothetical protein